MALKRTYLIGLCVGVALLGACDSTEDPGYVVDSGTILNPTGGGAAAGTAGAGTAGGATAGGNLAGGNLAGGNLAGGNLAGGNLAGGTASGGTASGGTASGGAASGGTASGGKSDGGSPGGSGDAGTGTRDGGSAGGGDGGGTLPPLTGGSCPGLPAVTDYAAKGPFDSKMFQMTGPDGTYSVFRPDATLGKDGFKHPVAVWGNGILTVPEWYQQLLGHLASHGFVIIACPSSSPERPCLNDGMEWLVKQNTAEGPMKGKLDTSKEITLGYSWGGGASIDTANRPNVKASVSFHGMPPRADGAADIQVAFDAMHAPLLLFTSIGDTFVSADSIVTPNYNKSKVSTFYATLQEDVGHLYVTDSDSDACVAAVLLGGPCNGAIKEQAPATAWLRYWVCGDENAKKYFFGSDCTLCKAPWKSQSKPAGAFK